MASVPPKTVVVLGASYGGARAAQIIAAGLPEGWRLVLIDRNSHLNHVYVLPRLAVLPGHEHKAFIPYDNIFNLGSSTNRSRCTCTFIQATILSLTSHSLTLSCAVPELGMEKDGVLGFEYAVYALGSRMPEPLDLWGAPSFSNCTSTCTSSCDTNTDAINGKPAILHAPYGGTKPEGIAWLKRKQRVVEEAASVLVVGGGALGIQFASDIASVHPTKRVTLLHSRARLLPRFSGLTGSADSVGGQGEEEAEGEGEGGEESGGMHAEILQALHALNVHVVLGERVDLSSLSTTTSVDDTNTSASASDADARADDTTTAGQRTARTVRTTTGRQIDADLVLLCTGQTPNTFLLRALDPRVVDPASGLARVGRGMQLAITRAAPAEGGDAGAGVAAAAPSMAPTGGGDHGRAARADGQSARSSTMPTRKKEGEEEPAPAPAPAKPMDAEAGKDNASLLAAALAEIELLDVEGAADSSSSSSTDLDLDSPVLDSYSGASPPHSLPSERDKQAAEPSPFASSPASTSRSLATERDKQAERVAFEETAVLAGETDEAASVDDDEETPYPHIFAIGDAADAFGALPAGHNAWAQGEVAGRNVLRLISRYRGNGIAGEGCEGKKREEDEELETYTPGPPAIKVSLGLHKTIYQVNGTVGVTRRRCGGCLGVLSRRRRRTRRGCLDRDSLEGGER
ncbi:hypothetical protein B0H13DRAFT_754194 [Mycena leptocephala]|nr:hypothetical protein B0H13DRAFT_754194 [Mycena leptocephala]